MHCLKGVFAGNHLNLTHLKWWSSQLRGRLAAVPPQEGHVMNTNRSRFWWDLGATKIISVCLWGFFCFVLFFNWSLTSTDQKFLSTFLTNYCICIAFLGAYTNSRKQKMEPDILRDLGKSFCYAFAETIGCFHKVPLKTLIWFWPRILKVYIEYLKRMTLPPTIFNLEPFIKTSAMQKIVF